jgi:hypothetical protein
MNELKEKVLAYNKELKSALETIYSELNNGQQKKLLKSDKVKALFDKYGISYKEG